MPRLSKIGAAALAAFGWTSGSAVTASYLVVAGGGGGGANHGGGGGAGGYQTGTTSLNPTQSYTVTVGAGGSGRLSGTGAGSSGSNSQLGTLTASVGGGAGGGGATTASSGGSGGGGGNASAAGTATSGQGNAGGAGFSGAPYDPAGGGGGAGAAGGAPASGSSPAGNGGNGLSSSISGSSVTYAGGGGGGLFTGGTVGTGGTGGGGAGSFDTAATSGTANRGGGGGGGGSGAVFVGTGGNGGSGVVIISYVGAQQFGGGVVTSSGGNTIHTFTTSGTLSPLSSLTASSLVVAGGGGGGAEDGGGGGAGGFRTGSGITLDTNSIYVVTVGAGGNGGVNDQGSNGNNSVFLNLTSTGGGGGGKYSGTNAGRDGGSGGGSASAGTAGNGNTPSTSPSQGNNGGVGRTGSPYYGGGGGGASAAGTAGTSGGNGGAGTASSISGSSVTYAGGGGGGSISGGSSGGAGGGGAGAASSAKVTGTAGTANTGGGGGGGSDANGDGGAGGSGIVIISYPGSTQLMAGGTVTVSGGNVIHAFTSSGYLTPIVLATNSLRFRSSAGAYLNRTPATTTNRRTWTWSGWVKRGTLGTNQSLFTCYFANNDTSYLTISFTSDNLNIGLWNTSILYTSAVYRDPSAWYHIVLAIDTTQATASDRAKLYVNGTQVTAFGSTGYPAQNTDLAVNSAAAHYISTYDGTNYKFDGYMADINFVDGQQLTPNSFGTFNGLGIWQPIRYGGSYGTNGFYLPFTNTTSTTTLGYDFSPQGNNWTTNNISLTAGTTYDSMTDVPTLTSATTANYCVLNPLDTSVLAMSNGNLQASSSTASWNTTRATVGITSGKFYWEYQTSSNNSAMVGIETQSASLTTYIGNNATGYAYNANDGQKYNNGTGASYGATYGNGDIIGVAFDADAGTLTFYKNNTSQGTAYSSIPTGTYFPSISINASAGAVTNNLNFGQQPFAYTPPTGFVALNTFNLPTPTIGATASSQANKYMNIALWTANETARTIDVGFEPGLVWAKSRSTAWDHTLFDSVRGSGKSIKSNTTGAEATSSTSLTGFVSNGFTLGVNSDGPAINYATGQTFVGWAWQASGSGSSNTAGSITSTVSANTTAGFSIVTYTGTGANATVGHGLGVAPSMVIVKMRSAGGNDWQVYHSALGQNKILQLNLTTAVDTITNYWYNGTTSTVFGVNGSYSGINSNGATYVAYCFAQVAGYSAFGSYTGNGSTDGTFVYLGFRPRFIMVKKYSSTENWAILDSSRSPSNVTTADLYPDLANAEDVGNARADLLSNGIKFRTGGGQWNLNGADYIYMAFAENPFKYANAR